ncbi:MAG: ribonuclease HII [Nitrososphaerota archaeon]|nr:ribonuclease HII [Nitrososphaerota archaeon]
MIVAGVDEAGRGSVLGPLVVAAVSLREESLSRLRKIGVKDSKLLSPARRNKLFREIKNISNSVSYEKIYPSSIDRVVLSGEKLHRLNYLEAQAMAKLLSKISFDRAFVDCCDTNQQRFGFEISHSVALRLGNSFTLGERNPFFDKITSEHHADRNYVVVSAASIVAKVTRDATIARLSKVHGNIGSGYPSDSDTMSYLKACFERSRTFPDFVRHSWLTIRRMKDSESRVTASTLDAN